SLSLRGQRNLVLSTHVEVVPEHATVRPGICRALHARGGGPRHPMQCRSSEMCSPRTWRWSVTGGPKGLHRNVLSTHVEVVRRSVGWTSVGTGALHARGGGPRGRA